MRRGGGGECLKCVDEMTQQFTGGAELWEMCVVCKHDRHNGLKPEIR